MVYLNARTVSTENVSFSEGIGQSEAFLDFQAQISRVAPIDRPVLVLGERGTGKELAAARIHFMSKRWQNPLVTLNCAALTSSLIGSELFGYEKGAFTGADRRQAGRFELASNGTLFLDEIGNIPVEVQEKILRVVEYGSFERVGASQPIHVDVRMVAAANVDLSRMASMGRFKQDLLDRLSFEVIYVPPLRFRKGDILLLASHFANRMAFELGWDEMPELGPSAVNALEAHSWPGNVRELKNVIERAVYKSMTREIKEISFDPFSSPFGALPVPHEPGNDLSPSHDISADFQNSSDPLPDLPVADLTEKPLKAAIAALERYRLSSALRACHYNQKKAADALGLTYDQFRGIKKKHKVF
ncbi:MAG: phage shock protein operon transcriptional activator [Thermodesulfobacteriota bacterium]|nr:phage shock protein operon transcriptional activator [Thermodesulfobacteriota bacterium]